MSLLRLPLTAAVIVLLVSGGAAQARLERESGTCASSGAGAGAIAYLRGSDLRLLDLSDCHDRVLAHGARPPVRFSDDGRWIAFGAAELVSVSGGRILHPLPGAALWRHSWAWAPRRDLVAAVTKRGGVLLGGPGLRPRRVVRDGWGAREVIFDRGGYPTVSRVLRPATGAGRRHEEIGGFLGPNLTPNQFFAVKHRDATPLPATWSPDGKFVFFWVDPFDSASIEADGVPLKGKSPAAGIIGPLIAKHALVYDDFLSWCRSRLVVAAGFDRYATHGKRLLVASWRGPAYGQTWLVRDLSRDPSRSWVSPACSPDGRLVAAAAGRNWIERRFGQEGRSIWLLASDGSTRRRLTRPPTGRTDEGARWSADGRSLLFVRSGPTNKQAGA